MNDQTASPGAGAPANHPPAAHEVLAPGHVSLWNRNWVMATIASVAMVFLALFGVGLSTADSHNAPTYWLALVPVFGLLSIATAWSKASHSGQSHRPMVLKQVLHWAGVAGAISLDYILRRTGEESGLAVGLNALLLLAVGCYLAGVYFEWRFILVGLLLTAALVIVAKANQYSWLIFVIGACLIAVLIGMRWVMHRFSPRKHGPRIPVHPSPAAS